MSRFERNQNEPTGSPADATHEAPAPAAPISDAEDAAAHIADMVRRTTERHGTPGPSPAAHPDAIFAPATAVTTPPVTPPVAVQGPAEVSTQLNPQVFTQVTPGFTPPGTPPATREEIPAPPPSMWPPSRRNAIAAGILVALLVGGGVALSQPFGPADAASPPASAPKTSAPAGYTVKVTDVVTDCASHSRGRTQTSFEAENCVKATRSLATGQVGGRPVLYVVSRIEMATSEAAASVKQVLDSNGTGNLNDLLRERKTYPGAPIEMPISGYASVQKGKVVTVAEAGFVDDGRSSNKDPALRSAAAEVAAGGTPAAS
jgi:hypothetical protein